MGSAGTRIKIPTGANAEIDKALDRAAWLEAESGSQLTKVGAEARSQHRKQTDSSHKERLSLPRVEEATANAQADPAGYGPEPGLLQASLMPRYPDPDQSILVGRGQMAGVETVRRRYCRPCVLLAASAPATAGIRLFLLVPVYRYPQVLCKETEGS